MKTLIRKRSGMPDMSEHRCSHCQRQLARDLFPKHSGRKSGIGSWCLACTNESSKRYSSTEHGRAKRRLGNRRHRDSVHGRRKHRQRNAEHYRQHRRERIDHILAVRKANPEKYKARRRAYMALNKGLIVKPNACPVCGFNDRRLEMHHDDYLKPLEIRWLCSRCHGLEHRI